jgi:hypothetical protein
MAYLPPQYYSTGRTDGGSLVSIKGASSCYLPKCLGTDDLLAIRISLALKHLAVTPGGANYSFADAKKQAALWLHQLSQSERDAMDLWLSLQNALNAGAQFPNGTSINGLKLDAKCIMCLGIEAKRNLLQWLKWKLNTLGEPE